MPEPIYRMIALTRSQADALQGVLDQLLIADGQRLQDKIAAALKEGIQASPGVSGLQLSGVAGLLSEVVFPAAFEAGLSNWLGSDQSQLDEVRDQLRRPAPFVAQETETIFTCRCCDRYCHGRTDGTMEPGWNRIDGIDGPDAICPSCSIDQEALTSLHEDGYPDARIRRASS